MNFLQRWEYLCDSTGSQAKTFCIRQTTNSNALPIVLPGRLVAMGLIGEIQMKSLFATTLSLLLLIATTPAQASVSATIAAGHTDQNKPYSLPATTMNCAGCVNSVEHSGAFSNAYSSGEVTVKTYAMADYGVLKSLTAVSGSSTGITSGGEAHSSTSFQDYFTIDAPSLTGQRGYFTAQVAMPFTSSVQNGTWTNEGIYGEIRLESQGNILDKYSMAAGDSSIFGGYVVNHYNEGGSVRTDAPMILQVSFIYGEQISIFGALNTTVLAKTSTGSVSYSDIMDASHSLYWNGIRSVTDRNGRAVTGYTITSDSGTDWTRNFAATSVPEPTSALLMLAGLGALLTRRRPAQIKPTSVCPS
jgi:hypothetical protein